MWIRLLVLAVALAASAPAQAQGNVWTQTHKFSPAPADYPRVLELAEGPNGALLVGLLREPGGLQRSMDLGDSWTPLGLDPPHVESVAAADDGAIYVGAYAGGVRRSDDGGATWVPSTLPTALVWTVVLDVRGGVLAGTLDGGLYRSTDRGGSWKSISPVWDVREVAALPDGALVVALSGGDEHRSGDGGATWEEVGVPGAVSDFASAPGGLAFANGSVGVSRSADGGRTWALVRPGAGSELAVSSEGGVFAGHGGVSRSTDGGTTWEDVSAGLTGAAVTALVLDRAGYLYAGTGDGRIFRNATLNTATEGRSAPTEAVLLHSAYPNPFGTSTRIAFTLRRPGWVDVKVYDMLGRQVGALVQGSYPAGRHEVEWAPAGAAGGAYLVRLHASDGSMQGVRVVRHRR